jgi:O-antigen/teichoic acid export membrane protein
VIGRGRPTTMEETEQLFRLPQPVLMGPARLAEQDALVEDHGAGGGSQLADCRRCAKRRLFLRWDEVHPLLGGGAWTLAGKLVNAIALLGLNAVLARALPPAELASYILAFSAATMLGILCALGLDCVAVRSIAEAREIGDNTRVYAVTRRILLLLTRSAALIGIATSLIGIPVFLHSSANVADWPILLPLVGIWTALNGIRLVLAGMLRGFQAMAASALFEGTLANSLTSAIVTVIYLGGVPVHLTAVLAVAVGCNAVSGVLALRNVSRSRGVRPAAFGEIPASSLLAIALPLVATALFGQIMVQLPLWIVAAMGSAQDSAVFGLGLQMSVLASLPFVVITVAGAPIAARLNAAREFTQMRLLLRRVALLAAMPAAAAVAIAWLFGADLMALIFGSPYRASAALAAILCTGRLVQCLTGLNEMLLTMTGGERALSMILVAGACLTGPACVAGFYSGGLVGVAAANGLLMVAQGVALAAVSHRRMGFWPGLGWLT